MIPHHHILGLAFRAALVGSALLLAAKSAGLAAEGLGAFDPDQAVVFDGSTAAKDIFTVTVKRRGYLVELSEAGFVCPDADHSPPSGVASLVEAVGVFPLELETGKALLLPVPSASGELPPELEALDTDCDLLAAFPALETYLLSVDAQAQARLAETQACRDGVRNLYCRVVAAVEEAATLEPTAAHGPILPGTSPYSDYSFGETDECPGLTHLADIPGLLDYLAVLVDLCKGGAAALAALRVQVVEAVQNDGGLTALDKDFFLMMADAELGYAEHGVDESVETLVKLDGAMATLTEESLEASCTDCGEPASIGVLSGAVKLVAQRQAIGRFVGAFQSAARHADDPELSARLAGLAQRLATISNDRVLQVIFPSGSRVGQHFIALRPPDLPDDGHSPLVVVLTALEEGAPVPRMNGTDFQLLFEQVRLFGATLAREPDGSPPE